MIDHVHGDELLDQKRFKTKYVVFCIGVIGLLARQLGLCGIDTRTSGADGRIGNNTMLAVRDFQRKIGIEPADGYAGVTLLDRLRQAQ